MPQMSPINWLSLFFIFFLIFIMFNILNYFIFKFNMKKIYKNIINKKSFMNWKW